MKDKFYLKMQKILEMKIKFLILKLVLYLIMKINVKIFFWSLRKKLILRSLKQIVMKMIIKNAVVIFFKKISF